MEKIKSLSKAFILSIIIVFIFGTMFDLLGWDKGNTGLALTTMIIFTLLLCTYSIIDAIKDNK